ncbi:MAG: HD domain-containing protein [Caldilinea sp. CFX5]|nr:HD domain-containing protein [Caldilinea sp. CFX5]
MSSTEQPLSKQLTSSNSPSFLTYVQALKQLPRTGWLFVGVAQPESVAEHSFVTSWLALLLAEQINLAYNEQGLSQPLDVARVVQIALVHDLAESILTDLPKRSTDLLGKAVKQQAEALAMQQICRHLPNHAYYLACWQEYVDGATPEGRLVRDADKLEMIHQALCYEQAGQRNLAEFWQAHQWHYPVSRNFFEELCRLRAIIHSSHTKAQ